MALMLLTVSLMVATVFALVSLVLWVSGIHPDSSWVFTIVILLAAGTFGVARRFDRLWGARLAAGGRPARVLAAIFRLYRGLGFGRGNSIIALLSSRSSERKTALLTFAVLMPVMLAVLFGLNGLRDPEGFGNYARFPFGATASLDASHYDSMRQPERDPAVPFLQDAVVTGPYARLVVPFLPGRDDAAMRASCPGTAGDDKAALACLQRLHAVALDGKPLAGLHYDAGSDARTTRPALEAMIDVRVLPPGRHELRVARTDASARERAAGESDYVIPFWR
jgi:hypothetical protein